MIFLYNEREVDEAQAVFSALDHGVLYGMGVFETLRIYKGNPFLLDDHIQRLQAACEKMRIRFPYTLSEWEEQIARIVRLNTLPDAVIRITITGGNNGWGLHNVNYESPTTLMMIRALPENGYSAKKLRIIATPVHASEGVEKLKTINYMNHVMARQDIGDDPLTDGLFLSSEGNITEAITSNLFFVMAGSIFTPSLEGSVLPGITRNIVSKIAKKLGYSIEEGIYHISTLDHAEEIFLTNSVQGIVRVSELQGKETSEYCPVTRHLLTVYSAYTHHLRSVEGVE